MSCKESVELKVCQVFHCWLKFSVLTIKKKKKEATSGLQLIIDLKICDRKDEHLKILNSGLILIMSRLGESDETKTDVCFSVTELM